MKKETILLHSALIFVQVTFGIFYVVSKVVLEDLHPLSLAGIRVICAAPILLLTATVLDRQRPKLRDFPLLALLGLLGVCVNQVLFIVGLQYTTPMNAAILMPSIPVFAAGLAIVLRIEKISLPRLVGVMVAVFGALIVLNITKFTLDHDLFYGNFLILLNCISFSIFLVLQQPLLMRLPALTVIAWAFMFGGFGVLIISWRELIKLHPSNFDFSLWAALIFIVLIPTTFNYYINTWAMKRTTPSLVAAYITLQPVTSALLSAIFLGQLFTGRELLGLLFILLGLFLVNRNKTGAALELKTPKTAE